MSLNTAFAEAFVAVQEHVVRASHELFEAYDTPLSHLEDGTAAELGPGDGVASIIGYAGSHIRGALVLLSSRAFAANLQPGADAASDAEIRDLFGEFSNMLLGRIKNQLLRRSVVLMLATPTTLFGQALRLPTPIGGTSTWHAFDSPHGRVFVRFDATFDPDFVLGDEEPISTEDAPAAEGDLMIF